MKRFLLFIILISVASTAFAGGWTQSGGYWWYGGQAYTRTRKACGCGYDYVRAYPPVNRTQYSNISTRGNTITVTNNYYASQPAASGGATAYGYYATSYNQLDLIGAITASQRSLEQGIVGLHQNIGAAAQADIERSRVAQILAAGEAASKIAAAVVPPPSTSVQTISVQGVSYQMPNRPYTGGIDGLAPVIAQNCATCHSASGGSARQDAIARFNLDGQLGPEQKLDAITALTMDQESQQIRGQTFYKMPPSGNLDAQTRGNLIQAFASQ